MESIEVAEVETPLGKMQLSVRGGALCTLGWNLPPLPTARAAAPAALELAARVTAYFAGNLRAFAGVRFEPAGTDFQHAVWAQLVQIPPGETRSYGQIAAAIGKPSASRAVGAANGANPIAVAVPCHRVIGASGALTGYGSGLPRKRWLLDHEGANGREQRAQIALFGERVDERDPQVDARR